MQYCKGASNSNCVFLVVPISQTHYIVPPIGLGYLASALRSDGHSNVVILDCLKERMSYQELRQFFKKWQPKIVGFQVFSYDFNSVVKSIRILKEECPESKVLIGGPHVSATAADSLREIEGADFGFVGEAEIGLPLLVRRILGEEIDFKKIPGLVWRENNIIYQNPKAIIKDLDSLKFPAWDLISPASYPDTPQGAFYMNFPIAPISTTRGCPYACSFCGSGVNMGHKLRFRKINNVLDEMEMLYRDFTVKEFHIIDDLFNFNKERVLQFCQGIKDRKLKISYTFPNGLRLNQIDKEMLREMKATGLYAFTVGIESGSQRILDLMNKNLSLEIIEEKINLIKSVGLEPNGFFIIGYPGETIEDIKATVRFAKKLKLKRAHFSNFLPLPGTEATKALIDSGELKNVQWDTLFYSKVPYAPKGITKKQLKNLQRMAFLEFYLRPDILYKMILDIKSLNHLKSILKRAFDYLFGITIFRWKIT